MKHNDFGINELSEEDKLALKYIIDKIEAGKKLTEDEIHIVVQKQHPEYRKYFEHPEKYQGYQFSEDEPNPYLHVIIHSIVENQLQNNEPKETRETLERLLKEGQSRQEIIHKIGTVVVSEIFGVLKHKRVFDKQKYVNQLKKLR